MSFQELIVINCLYYKDEHRVLHAETQVGRERERDKSKDRLTRGYLQLVTMYCGRGQGAQKMTEKEEKNEQYRTTCVGVVTLQRCHIVIQNVPLRHMPRSAQSQFVAQSGLSYEMQQHVYSSSR